MNVLPCVLVHIIRVDGHIALLGTRATKLTREDAVPAVAKVEAAPEMPGGLCPTSGHVVEVASDVRLASLAHDVAL